MKLTENDIKIKCTIDHLKTLFEYLTELTDNSEAYLKTFLNKPITRNIYKYGLNSIREKVAKLLFNGAGSGKQFLNLKINHAERIILFETISVYNLPLDINFIEYEIKNRLLI